MLSAQRPALRSSHRPSRLFTEVGDEYWLARMNSGMASAGTNWVGSAPSMADILASRSFTCHVFPPNTRRTAYRNRASSSVSASLIARSPSTRASNWPGMPAVARIPPTAEIQSAYESEPRASFGHPATNQWRTSTSRDHSSRCRLVRTQFSQ